MFCRILYIFHTLPLDVIPLVVSGPANINLRFLAGLLLHRYNEERMKHRSEAFVLLQMTPAEMEDTA